VFQPLNSATPDRSEHDVLSSLHYGLEVLENNPARTDGLISGNIYIYDLVEQRNLSGSCSVANMLGYLCMLEEPLGLASLIHPDDLNRVTEHFQQFTTLRYDEVIRIDYRMRRADNQWCWLRSQETPLVMAIDGFPLQILGIIQMVDQLSSPRKLKSLNRRCKQRKVNLNENCS